MNSGEILVIEDNHALAEEILLALESLGFTLLHEADGQRGLERGLLHNPALVVLDIMLPGLGGAEVCQQLRAGGFNGALLMLSAKDDELSKVLLLESGADDYMTKPFSPFELRARVKAILRRTQSASQARTQELEDDIVVYRDLRIDFAKKLVSMRGEPIALTPTEFSLLEVLARRPGTPHSRDSLGDILFGGPVAGFETSVSSHVSRIRKKIEIDPNNPEYLVTVRGFGYALGDPSR